MVRVKHIPTRQCVVCCQSFEKRDLMRFVRLPEGEIALDPGGKASGRGAYLCRSEHCWGERKKWQKLARSLSATLSKAQVEELEAHIHRLGGPE